MFPSTRQSHPLQSLLQDANRDVSRLPSVCPVQLDAVDDSAVDEFEKQRPSRKQKSLGLLCQKFLARYPSYPLSTEKTTISLDEVAISLNMYHGVTWRPVSSYGGNRFPGRAEGFRSPPLLSTEQALQKSEDGGAGKAVLLSLSLCTEFQGAFQA